MSIQFGSRFRAAAEVINELQLEKFQILLNRILLKLHVKDARLFSQAEESQLQTVFGITAENLTLLLDGCSYVFEQAAFQSVGAEALYEQLQTAGIDDNHAKVFGRQWNSERAAFIAKLKQRTLGASSLQNTDYHLNLSMGDSSLSKLQDPSAIFELTLSVPASSQNEKLLMEFSHDELYSFFSQLEEIQHQLDSLS